MRIGICDDDKLVAGALAEELRDLYAFDIAIVAFDTAFSLLTYIEDEKNEPLDILFLDIRLREQNGVRVAMEIQEFWPEIQIIFSSGYPEYAQDIFQIEPVYFLLKPFDRESMKRAVDRAVRRMEEAGHEIVRICTQGEMVALRLRDVDYIESNRHQLKIWCGERCHELYGTLTSFAEKLPDSFLRCHQSYLVNIHKIRRMNADTIELFNGRLLPVSRSRYRQTREALLRYTANSI